MVFVGCPMENGGGNPPTGGGGGGAASVALTITPSTLEVGEGTSTTTFTVALSAAPPSDVTITMESSNTAIVTIAPTTLKFTRSNWGTAQKVTVTAKEDTNRTPDNVTIGFTATGVTLSPSPTPLAIRVLDNDVPGLTIDPRTLTVREEETSTYTVRLNTAPSGTATVRPESNNTDVTFSPAALTFTAATWSTAQTVTVSAAADSDRDDETVTLSHSVTGYGEFSGTPPRIALEVTDDNIRLHPNGVTVICGDANVGDTGMVGDTEYTKRAKGDITAANAERTCTSGITDMSFLFTNQENFNSDISSWDTSSVTNMIFLFSNTAFNQDIGGWDVSSVANMGSLFLTNRVFDQDISGWNVSSVTAMNNMFRNNSAFNQDISGWKVKSVTNMAGTFQNASAFNQDLSAWCVSGISSKPTDFDKDANSGFTSQPPWGSSTVVSCTPPTLAATNPTSPAEGTTGVAVDSNITFTFSENVSVSTGSITITPAGGTATSIAVSDSQVSTSTTTVTINPTADLQANTQYSVFLPANAFKDSDNVRTERISLSFTTQ